VFELDPPALVQVARGEGPVVDRARIEREIRPGDVFVRPVVGGRPSRWFGPVFDARIHDGALHVGDAHGTLAFALADIDYVGVGWRRPPKSVPHFGTAIAPLWYGGLAACLLCLPSWPR